MPAIEDVAPRLVLARLLRLDSEDLEGVPRVALSARVVAGGDAAATMEAIIGRLSLEHAVTRAGWAEDGEAT